MRSFAAADTRNHPIAQDQPRFGQIVEAPALIRARTRTPRILYLTPYWPHRETTASELRSVNIARALEQFARVEVIVVGGEARGPEWRERPEKPFHLADHLPVEHRPNRGLRQKLRWVVDPRTKYPHGCGVNDEAGLQTLRTVREFDLTWFFKLRTANMFAEWRWPGSVVDIDDVPSTFERSILDTELPLAERLQTYVRLWSWARRDRLLGDRFSLLGVCSETDRRYLEHLGVRAPIHVIPNGAKRPAQVPPRCPASPPRLGFIGIFDYEPNREGVEWFVRECWARIKRELPEARLRLVGRHSDGPLKPEGEDIDGLGFLPDPSGEISSWSAMIVPVRTGAGTRGKIAHGFSQKCPIVSTTLGAYGYEVPSGDALLLADSPETFAQACVGLIREPSEAAAMAERAWQKFLENWTWDAVGTRVRMAAGECLRLTGQSAPDGVRPSEKDA